MKNVVKSLILLAFMISIASTSAAITGDQAEALIRHLYSNYKEGKVIVTTERGEIFKNDKFHCAYEGVETSEILKIDGDKYTIETVYFDNINEECTLKESGRDIQELTIQNEAQQVLEFARFLRKFHQTELSIDIDKKTMTFETDAPKRKVDIFYDGMTPLHLESELTQSGRGEQQIGSDVFRYEHGRLDIKIK